MLFFSIFTLFTSCNENEKLLSCGENDVLQECDADNNCTTIEDCAANDQICHDMGAESHCMDDQVMGADTAMGDM